MIIQTSTFVNSNTPTNKQTNKPTNKHVQVNAKYEGKTGAHVAIEEGNINALRVLMDFNANLELEVS